MDPTRTPAATLEALCLLFQRALNRCSLMGDPILTSEALLELNNSLNANPFNPVDTGLEASRLDRQATNLWNTCTVMSVTRASNPEHLRILAKVRAFAFALLNSSQDPDLMGFLRSVQLGLVAARICIVNQEPDIAVNIITAVYDRLNYIQLAHPEVDPIISRGHLTTFYLLRIRLAWLQGTPDVIEHFWAQVPGPITAQHRQMILESCFIMGDRALAQYHHDVAVTWLQRALDHLQELDRDPETFFPSYNDWELLIRHSLVVACMRLHNPSAAIIRLTQMLMLKQRFPEHPSVVLLELSSRDAETTSEELLEGLKKFVESTRLTTSNMPVIYQFARCLGQRGYLVTAGPMKTSLIAHSGLEDGMEALRILLMRPMPSHDWTEKCFVAFVLLMSRRPDTGLDGMSGLRDLIDDLEKRGFPDLSRSAAHATVTCLWKLIGTAIQKHEFWDAREWLSICASPKLRRACSEEVIVAIQKKLITCHILDGSVGDARELLDGGLVQDQLDLERMYLAFKLTLMEGGTTSNLFALGFPPGPDTHKQLTVLACAMEAYKQGKSHDVLNCLEQFPKFMSRNDIYHDDFTAAEHFTFVITLLLKELSRGFSYRLGQLIKSVIHYALEYARENSRLDGGPKTISVTQLQWLYHTTYETALKLFKSPGLAWVNDVLEYSREFACLYRQIAYLNNDAGEPRPHLFAVAYLELLAESAEARGEVDPDVKVRYKLSGPRVTIPEWNDDRDDHTDKNQRMYYEKVRTSFTELNDLSGWSDEEEPSDLNTDAKEDRQLSNAQFFDLEAAMHLGQWDDVARICQSNDTFPKQWFYPPLMDLTLKLDLPPALAHVIRNLEDSLCETPTTTIAERPNFRTSYPRYLHILFTLAISPDHAPTPMTASGLPDVNMVDAKTAEEVIDQVIAIVEQGTGIKSGEEDQQDSGDILRVDLPDSQLYPFQEKYPTPELLKMAGETFNRATDYYRVVQDDVCKRWANKAILLARQVPGPQGQALVQTLESKLATLALL
ncbi:Meiosis specific protein SPO22 [Penicillium sp. DV-2018c]|nr:Meiosis specific protein SPO22 [Penicillium sp. DV-2018c]